MMGTENEKERLVCSRKSFKITLICGFLAVWFVLLYLIAVYSNIGFIAKWRTIYIETAMSTMTHQWLATAFIPGSVIDEVMQNTQKDIENSAVASSDVYEPEKIFEDLAQFLPPREKFSRDFPEIDMQTLPEFDSYSNLNLKDIASLGVRTVSGDSVWAIDAENGICIVEVKGDGYVGKLAIVHDPAQVKLGRTSKSSSGETVTQICNNEGAILGINASGFVDYGGHGSGSTPVGLEISEGAKTSGLAGGRNQICGIDLNNNLRLGYDLDISELRDAVEFYPIVVLNGEKNVNGSFGLGLQPRSVIGQRTDGAILLLIIDGRQVGHSLGATVSDCADILLNYDAYNAINLDGGSSASMTYDGEMITKTSSPAKAGRTVPNAWIVMPKEVMVYDD